MLKLALLSLFALANAHDERLMDEDGHYHHRGCATEQYNEELLANDPEWQQSLNDFEVTWAARSKAIQSGQYKVEQKQITIPIIYHFVSQNPTSVPDEAFAYQLNVLQEDFAAENNDYTSGTPVEFRDVRSGDTQIKYTVQNLLRVPTNQPSFSSNNGIKSSSSGGSDVIAPDSNLNFWVGTLSGGLLGYAQFPGGNPSTDGIVCATGTLAPSVGSPPYNLGRTGTHEIGHWLNLRHIWGDNSGCTNTELISDFVTDTPPSSSSNFGCPAGVKRCSANPYSQDMYMNFMDYVEDDCMVMFTILQNARAQRSIEEYRGGFGSSNVRYSDKEYINWLYFTKFEEEQDDDNKCVGDHVLFYDNNINEDSGSNVYIYGCVTKTNAMSVSHITDIKFIDGEDCGDGYYRASQDLNEGNAGSIFMCYNKVDSTEDNENLAILDMTFIKDDDASKLDINLWEINDDDNINPNGIKLNFAMKKGQYFQETATLKGSTNGDSPGLTQEAGTFIGIGVGVVILAALLIGVVVWKYVCSRKGFTEYMNESLSKEYGATTELTNMQI